MNQNLGLIKISGPDSSKFLQGQLTCDVNKLEKGDNEPAGMCTAQGRLVATFHLFCLDEQMYLMRLPQEMVELVLKHLGKYAVFSKVELVEVSLDDYATFNRAPGWRLNDIRAGFPNIFVNTTEKFLPHRVNFNVLGGVSFDKGCYTGQEIIARTEYLGKNKYSMCHVMIESDETLATGVKLLGDDESVIANVVDAVKTAEQEYEALLILKDKNVGNLNVTLLDLPYTV